MAKHRSSTNSHGEGTTRGEATSVGFSSSTGLSEHTSIGTSSDSRSSMRVRHVAEDFECQIRDLAKRFTVAEFITLRAKVEDVFDSVLLGGLR